MYPSYISMLHFLFGGGVLFKDLNPESNEKSMPFHGGWGHYHQPPEPPEPPAGAFEPRKKTLLLSIEILVG